jgi:hypothetical protein
MLIKKTKKNYLLVITGALACCILFSAYKEGPAIYGKYDCTGAETGLGNPKGCSCHSTSATTGIACTLELDSAGVPTTHYVGGMSYTVKITGTNNTSSILPKFGFQIGCIEGSTAQVTPTNAGTWVSPYPANTHYAAPNVSYYVLGVTEHGTQLAPSSGTGGNGTIYSETLNWTAPVSGTGVISFFGVLNAVNDDGTVSGDSWNLAHILINEWSSGAGITNIEPNPFSLNIMPNPAISNTTLEYTLQEEDNLELDVYDITGKKVWSQLFGQEAATVHNQLIDIAGLHLNRGLYIVLLTNGNEVSSKKLLVE